MGRKTKLTKDCQDIIVESLKLGLKVEDTINRAGISRETYFEWIRRGQANDGKVYVDFADAVKNAEYDAKASRLERIKQAGIGGQTFEEKKITNRMIDGKIVKVEEINTTKQSTPNWQADAWLLERKYPDEFGRKYQVENLNVDLTKLTDEQLERIAKGENAAIVVATSGASRDRTEKAPEGENE